MVYIGIDLGTSSVKVLAVAEDGAIRKEVTREYALSFPQPGWSEQEPADWWEAVTGCLREITAEIPAEDIAGVGCAGQMHGLVVLDEEDRVIRPAILWNDGRTQPETDWLNEEIGRETLTARTGNIAFAGFTAPKILWMRKNEPEKFARIRKIMLPKDYINYLLTGVFSTDYSDASGMLLLDVEHKCWSREMMEVCSVTEEQLPKLYESFEVTGTVCRKAAEVTGLSEKTVVTAGAGDNAAAAVGTGTVGNGACNLSVGTSGTVFVSSDRFSVDSGNALHAFAHADGKWHLMGCILSAASCNQWWLDGICGTRGYGEEQAKIDRSRLGRNTVFFLPYLMGERAPHNDAFARGAFVGMTMDTGRADMTQAVLEGVAFGIRDSFEAAKKLGVEVKSSMICGGGAKSALWRRIFADVLNITLTVPQTEQGPGYGGAMMAMTGSGLFPSVGAAAAALVKTKETICPDPETAALYEERYKVYRALYPALKPVFHGGICE